MKNIKNKLVNFGLGLLIASPFAIYGTVGKITGNPYNMKTMPQIQPWVWLYDKNNDGEADKAMVGYRGGIMGAISVVNSREPTQEEIKWYENN